MVRVQDHDNQVYEYTEQPQAGELYERAAKLGLAAWEYDENGYCLRNTINVPCTPPPVKHEPAPARTDVPESLADDHHG